MSANPDSLLVRGLGVRQLAAGIFNYTVGSGIFVLPALAVAQLGTAAPLAYLLCAVVMGLVVLVFAEAGSRVSATGGPYAYVETALGPLPGFVTGVLLAITDVVAAGAIAMLLARSITRLVGVQGAVLDGACATLLLAGFATVNVRGVRWGARLVEVCTAAKLVPLLFFVIAGAFFVRPSRLALGTLPGAGQIARTAGTLIFAYTGIEAALLPSGEVRDTARTVPRAALLALGFTTLLYLAVQAVAVGVAGPALARDTVAPLSSAAGTFAGSAGRALLLAGASISMFGWLTGSVLAGPRAFFAMARDGLLPSRIASVHAVYRTPHAAIVLYVVLALGLALSGTFEQLAVISNLAALGIYFLSAIAVLALRRRGVQTAAGAPFRVAGGALVPVLACAFVAWVVWATVTRREVIAFGVVLVLATVAYMFRRRPVIVPA